MIAIELHAMLKYFHQIIPHLLGSLSLSIVRLRENFNLVNWIFLICFDVLCLAHLCVLETLRGGRPKEIVIMHLSISDSSCPAETFRHHLVIILCSEAWELMDLLIFSSASIIADAILIQNGPHLPMVKSLQLPLTLMWWQAWVTDKTT